jgi:hypothetical protein
MNNEIINRETGDLTIDELDIVSGGLAISDLRHSAVRTALDLPPELDPSVIIPLKPFPTQA